MYGQQLIGRKLNKYFLEKILGQGSVAVVYQAVDTVTHQRVALKVFAPPAHLDPQPLLTRFQFEARMMARLHHPHIVRVIDTGQAEGYAFMAMPLVKGQTLEGLLKQRQRFDETAVTEIGWQIAAALNYAAEQGIIHRDVKPSNILITDEGQALLTDFGIAWAVDTPDITVAGTIVGTPAYIAPELLSAEREADGRSDLYSLGVILFRMAAGRLPFCGTTTQMLYSHVFERPPLPSQINRVSPQLEAIILQALAKEKARRFTSGREFAQALLNLNQQLRSEPPRRPWVELLRQLNPFRNSNLGLFA